MDEQKLKRGVDFIGVGVVFFCHDGKGNFAMMRRSPTARDEQNKWDIGGGGVEFNDTIEQTLKKEILEEYGASVLNYKFLGFRDVHRIINDQKNHWVVLDFRVLVNPKQMKIGEPHKFTKLRWCTFDTLPPDKEMHSQFPTFLKKYEGRL